MRLPLLLLAAFLALATLAGCAPAKPRAASADPEPVVRLALVGDILLGGGLAPLLASRGAAYPWSHAGPVLKQADLAIGNLETAVTRGGIPAPDKQYHFRSRPESLQGAAAAGIDVLSLANNHTLDFGPDALLDTIRHVRSAGIQPVGAGPDLQRALRPVTVTAKGLKIAVLSFSRVVPSAAWVAGHRRPGVAPAWDPRPVLNAISAARASADVVVVLVHWGQELKESPREMDVSLAHQMVQSGATVVAGHHPHVLQGIEHQGTHLIAWSLGNFIFTASKTVPASESGILEVTVGRGAVRGARFIPMVIVAGQPRPAPSRTRLEILGRLDRLSRPWQTRIDPRDGTVVPNRQTEGGPAQARLST